MRGIEGFRGRFTSVCAMALAMLLMSTGVAPAEPGSATSESGHQPSEVDQSRDIEPTPQALDEVTAAALDTQQVFNGRLWYSADGLCQAGGGGTIQAEVPAGSAVVLAYLYGAYYLASTPSETQRTINIDGTSVVLTQLPADPGPCCQLSSARADVTPLVSQKVGSGGGIFDFTIGNDPANLDGVGLLVVYANSSLPESTIAINDRGASQAGETTTFAYSRPVDKSDPQFRARLSLGVGFGYQGGSGAGTHVCGTGADQSSLVDVNAQRLTSCAGNYDDGVGQNGALITMGGVGDSPDNPADPFQRPADGGSPRVEDDELYDIAPFITDGDDVLSIFSQNPSGDDILFLKVVAISAKTVPQISDVQTYGGCALDGRSSPHANNPTGCQSDPVNSATGSFLTQATDMTLPGIGLPFDLSRTYTSADTTTGPVGQGWTHSYATAVTVDTAGNPTVRTESGQRLRYTADPDGSYRRVDGVQSELVATTGGWQLRRRDQVVYDFDGTGRLMRLTDRNGNRQELGYDGAGTLASLTDTTGRTIVFTHDTAGHLTRVDLPDGRSVVYGYSGDLLTSVTDPTGATTTYSYDAAGRLTTVTDANGDTVVSNSYNAEGRVTAQTDALGNVSTFNWDPANETATMTDARGNAWTDVYAGNVLVERRDPLGNLTSFGYDTDANLTSITDPRGNATTLLHDSRGNLLRRVAPDPLGYTESFTYNGTNDLLSHTDGRGNTTTFSYDAAGNLTAITEPGDVTTAFTYDASGLLTATTDPVGSTTTFAYDPAGNLLTATAPSGASARFGYDAAGRMVTLTDPRGNESGADPATFTTTLAYDPGDRLAQLTDPLGHATKWSYDAIGNLTGVTDAMGRTTDYAYNAASRLTVVEAADGSTTTYAYDPAGNLTGRTDGNGHTTSYGYDAANQLIEAVTPIGAAWRYGYDQAGNLVTATTAAGTVTTTPGDGTVVYGYDELNRLITVDFSDDTPDVGLTYDANGNRVAMVDGAGAAAYTYDALNRLTEFSRAGDTFAYAYDGASRIIERSYPDGRSLAYGYDADGRLATVTEGTGTTSYTYDAAGNLTGRTLPNGTSESRAYDPAGRLTAIRSVSGTTAVIDQSYVLDEVGNPLETFDDVDGTRTTYAYDVRDQLIEVCFEAGCADFLRYTYDPSGNRLTEERHEGVTTYTYDAGDQLRSSSGPAGEVVYTYDPNGNQTQAGDDRYRYDLANRLVEAAIAGGGEVDASQLIDGGGSHSLAVQADGRVRAWGHNAYGQLGDGTTTAANAPVTVSELTTVTGVAAGTYHSLALQADGTVRAWGHNAYGQLGDASNTTSNVPVTVAALSGVTRIAGGNYHSLAVRDDGTVWAWGWNGTGQLGDGTTTSSSAPVPVQGLNDVTAVTGGGIPGWSGHSLALKADGTVWAWGYNKNGQLGDGTSTHKLTPVEVQGLTGVVAIAADGDNSYALKADGTVWAWGDNSYGQLGNPSAKRRSTVPVQTSISEVASIAAGGTHAVAVKRDGTAWAWGNNNTGQLGNGEVGPGAPKTSTTPVRVHGLTDVAAVAGGYVHSLAALGDGTARAWGRNAEGQLGDSTNVSSGTPVPVQGLTDVMAGAGSTTLTYHYDGDGTRLQQQTDGTMTSQWLWDPNAPLPLLVTERDGAGSVRRSYSYGHDLIAMHADGDASYFHHDRIGNVAALTGATGALQRTYDYEPFGLLRDEQQHAADAPANLMRFTGELLDQQTGLYHLRARQYQPATGRFLQTDVVAAVAADPYLTPYTYVQNRPTVFVDHSGACPWCVLAAAGAAVGAAVSGVAYTVTSGDDFSWRGLGGAVAGGAVAGAVTAVAGPAAAGIVGSTGAAATATAAGINAVGGAAGAALQDYVSTGRVSPGNVALGAGLNAVGGYVGNRLFPTRGMSTPSQLRYFAPRTVRGMFSGRHNIRAVYSSGLVGGLIGSMPALTRVVGGALFGPPAVPGAAGANGK